MTSNPNGNPVRIFKDTNGRWASLCTLTDACKGEGVVHTDKWGHAKFRAFYHAQDLHQGVNDAHQDPRFRLYPCRDCGRMHYNYYEPGGLCQPCRHHRYLIGEYR